MFRERQAGQDCFRVLSLPCAVAQPHLAVRPCCAFSSRKGSLSPAGPAPLLAPAGAFSVLGGGSSLLVGRLPPSILGLTNYFLKHLSIYQRSGAARTNRMGPDFQTP